MKADKEDTYLKVLPFCERFNVSKSTVYRLLADESNGLADICIKVPPVTGSWRIPCRGFVVWSQNRAVATRRS